MNSFESVSPMRSSLMKRSIVAAFGVALSALVALANTSCTDVPPQVTPPLSGKASLGELVYRILRDQLAASDTCPTQYVAALEGNHEDFVMTFDYTLAVDVENNLPDVLGGTILPLVENGQLPQLVDQLAESMALLISDSFDPERNTLKSLVRLSEARTMLETSMVFDLVDAVLSDPDINDKIHALALLAQEHDGVDYVLDDALGLVSSALAYDDPLTCSGLEIPDVQATVFRTSGYVEDASLALGTPAFAVRPDENFNPRVRVDAMTGALALPFVDLAPVDGVADVNADGYPIDAAGAVIDIPILGVLGNRDVYGRALNDHGGLLYDYFDVKRTTLSYAAQIGADFIEGGYLHDIAPLAVAALGEPATCDYGTPVETCREYGTANHPIADLFFLGTEFLRFPKLVDLLDGLQQLLSSDPNKAETLLMTVGDVVTALDSTELSLTDTTLIGDGIELLPLVDQLFQVPNTVGGTSTPRLLANIVHDMGESKDQIPRQLSYLVEFQTITNRPTASIAPVGTAVDYSRPRFYMDGANFVDNSSALERLLDMVSYANCGYVGPTGPGDTLSDYLYIYLDALLFPGADAPTPGTLAQVMVDAASRATPEQLKTLLGIVDWFTSNAGGSGLTDAMTQLGCGAQANALAFYLPVIKTFQNTGALDWVVPIAQVFGAQGQRDVVIQMALQLGNDLRRDGGAYQAAAPHWTPVTSTASVIRRLEPALLSIMKSGALDRLLDALDTLYTIQVGGDNAVQLMLDVAAYAVHVEPAGVPTRQGNVANTSRAAQVLLSLNTLAERVNAADADDELSHLLHFVTGYVQRTDDLGHGSRRLRFRNLRLLLSVGSELLHDAAMLSPTDFTCYVDELQSRGLDFLVKRDFATIVRIANQLLVSPNAAGLEGWVVSLLRGMPSNPYEEPYGRALQILAAVASSDPDQVTEEDLSSLTHWLSGVVGQTTGASAREIIATIDTLVLADTDGAIFQIVLNAIGPGPLASGEQPIMTFADHYDDVSSIDSANMCMAAEASTFDVPRIERTISSILDFVHDDENGLGAIWDLIGTVAPAE